MVIRFCCVVQCTKQRDALEESTPYNGIQLTFASSPAPRLKSMVNLTAGNRPSRECPLARRSTHAATLVNEQRIVWCLFTVLVHLFDGRKPIEKPCLFSGTTWRILAWCHKGADPQRSPAVAAASSVEDSWLRRIQMNFTGIKDFQTRVDIARFSVLQGLFEETSWLGGSQCWGALPQDFGLE